MQFSTAVVVLFSTLASFTLAGREDTIRKGLAVVGNHAYDQFQTSNKAIWDSRARGDMQSAYRHGADASRAFDTNNALHQTVRRVKPVVRRSLEFLGSDDTHEYFARSIVEEQDFEDYY